MKTSRQAFLLAMCIAASAMTAPTIASAGISVDIEVAPPPVRIETVPAPRAGYIWAPGFWEWRGHEHVWVEGRWIGERKGYHWVPDRWEPHGSRYHYEPGHWVR